MGRRQGLTAKATAPGGVTVDFRLFYRNWTTVEFSRGGDGRMVSRQVSPATEDDILYALSDAYWDLIHQVHAAFAEEGTGDD